MKFEFEISDEVLKGCVHKHVDTLVNHSQYGNARNPLWNLIAKEVNDVLVKKLVEEVNFTDLLRPIVEREVKAAGEKKIPGWVARRVKEFLEAARLLGTTK